MFAIDIARVNFCGLITIAGENLPDHIIKAMFDELKLEILGTREVEVTVKNDGALLGKLPALQFIATSPTKLDVPTFRDRLCALDEILGVSVAERNILDFLDLRTLTPEGNA